MALSYSRAFTTSNMSRLACTWREEYKSISWYRVEEGFTTNGDATLANRYNTVVIKTPQVTATGWNNSGSTTYNIYCVLYTPYGSWTTETVNLKWDDNTQTRTLTFTFDAVLGEWTKFEIWAQQWTYTTNSHYLYWFNNSGGTITVTYTESENIQGSPSFIVDNNGNLANGKTYVWKNANQRTYTFPETGMTSDDSQGCISQASTVYNNTENPAWYAFNGTQSGAPWSSKNANSESTPWLQLTFPKPLYNIKVGLYNRNADYDRGPIDGTIYGSNDGGTTLTAIGSFSGRTSGTGYYSFIQCNNTNTSYTTVRMTATNWGNKSGNGVCSVGQMTITGTDIGTSGNWVEANSLVWKTSNPITYTYPEAAMTGHISQGCFVTASTEDGGYNAYMAFDKNAGNNWASTADYDSQPWIQITIPRPLYNISVQINNDSGTAKGPVAGIIYGSNNNGLTLTQIGSFSGRDPAKSVSTTHQCNNTTTAYDTIRIKVTTMASGATNVDIGEIYISGTDIGSSGGWAGSVKTDTICYPQTGMNHNRSRNCIASASTEYSSAYQAYLAFNYSIATGTKPWSASTSDTAPYIQLTMPEPLYNIQVMILNRYDSTKSDGAAAGIIYGSDNDGTSLTQIGSFSGRAIKAKAGSTVVCNNTSTAYSTVRIKVTDSNGVKDFCIGEIYIIGTKNP